MTLQFSHANGFSASTYTYFLSLLEQTFAVRHVNSYGHGKYPPINGWHNSAKELIEHVKKEGGSPVVGLGHSMGGVFTLWAALQRPDLFSQIVLFDPPLFGNLKRNFLRMAQWLGIEGKLPPASFAAKRRTHFPNRETARTYFAPKPLFKNFHPHCFDDYINFGLKENEQGLELAFSAKAEYDYFRFVPKKVDKTPLKVPATLVYSNAKQVLNDADLKWLKKRFPDMNFMSFDGGHLFPLEKPHETAELLKRLSLTELSA